LDPLGTTLGIVIAFVMLVVALYFAWGQQRTLQTLHADPKIPRDQRAYLSKQCWRRLFGSLVLVVLAGLLIGSVFLDYDPLQMSPDDVPQVDRETAKQAVRFLSFYLMTMLLLLMVILTLAVFDFWATARNSIRLQKQLLHEHQEMLEAELEEQRHRRAELN
jgi:predicted PurR-regulated permease PerM